LKDILLIVSGSSGSLKKALDRITRKYPDSKITLVSRLPIHQDAARPNIASVMPIECSGGMLSRAMTYWSCLSDVRRTHFDGTFIMATNEGFLPLKVLGLLSRAGSKSWINENGDWFDVRDIRTFLLHLRWRWSQRTQKLVRSPGLLARAVALSPYILTVLTLSTLRRYLRRYVLAYKRCQ